jgi:hypothetical protein
VTACDCNLVADGPCIKQGATVAVSWSITDDDAADIDYTGATVGATILEPDTGSSITLSSALTDTPEAGPQVETTVPAAVTEALIAPQRVTITLHLTRADGTIDRPAATFDLVPSPEVA